MNLRLQFLLIKKYSPNFVILKFAEFQKFLRLQKLGKFKFAANSVILKEPEKLWEFSHMREICQEFQKFLRLQKLGKNICKPNSVILKEPENPCKIPVYRRIASKFQFILRLQKLGKNLCKPKIIILKISEIQGTLRLQILGKTKILNQIYAKIVKMEVLWITKLPKDYGNCIGI